MSKNPGYYCPSIGQKGEHCWQVNVIFDLDCQARGVVTGIIAQNDGIGVAHILMTWS